MVVPESGRAWKRQGPSKLNLALHYCKGEGVRQSSEGDLRWHRKAAEQGHVIDQNSLAQLPSKGSVV